MSSCAVVPINYDSCMHKCLDIRLNSYKTMKRFRYESERYVDRKCNEVVRGYENCVVESKLEYEFIFMSNLKDSCLNQCRY